MKVTYNDGTYSDYLPIVSVTTLPKLKAPVLYALAGPNNSVVLYWTNNDTDVTGYTVFDSLNNTITSGSLDQVYAIENLTPNKQYCYSVMAVFDPDNRYDSDRSNVACAKVVAGIEDNTLSSSDPVSFVAGANTFTLNTADPRISSADLLVDGTVVATDTTAPYNFSFNSARFMSGSRSVFAMIRYPSPKSPVVTTPVMIKINNSASTYALTVTKSGSGVGAVTGTGINCGNDCSESYSSGAPVTLTAKPAVGSLFHGWSGACSGTGTCTVTMNITKSVSAVFTLSSLSQSPSSATSPVATPLVISGGTKSSKKSTFSGWVGFRFQVGHAALSVSELGRFVIKGSKRSHLVKLVNENGTDVLGGTVTINTAGIKAGTYAYAPFPAPITLVAGATYFLVSQEVVGGDFWYNYPKNKITLNNVAKATGAAWANIGTNSYVVPNSNLPETYGPLNLKYK